MKTYVTLSAGIIVFLFGYANWAAADTKLAALQSDWGYRKAINLDPATSQPDSVVLVVLTTESMGNPYVHVNQDGSDLRFTGPDGKTPLSYWIESWDRAGVSKIWVKVPSPGTEKIYVHYGNPKAKPVSDGTGVFDFFDDFNDGIWTKHAGNPVMTRTEPWEARCICEPSVMFEDGIFKMWYMGCKTSVGRNAAMGYATSPDGFLWTKHPENPILRDPQDAILRTTVVKHKGTYYLFATDYQWNDTRGIISRWTSKDGLHWTDKTPVLTPTEPWERPFDNTGIIIEDDGTWRMLYVASSGKFGYAYSSDGLHWTKYKGNPVITGFYGGDPGMMKVGDKYYAWHSQACKGGHLRIHCRWSTDMIHWKEVYNNPQINYTQPFERGIGRDEVNWDRHLADAELMEHDGKVFLYYSGAQCPLGVAVFDGTFKQLAARLEHPPLSKWAESAYGCVENKELKISDTETDSEPIYQRAAGFSDRDKYVLEFRACCYAGYRQEQTQTKSEGWSSRTKCYPASTRRIAAVMRYVDNGNFARFRIEDGKTTYYEQRVGGVWAKPANIGANNACDADWHRWKIVVAGEDNYLYIDGKHVGAHKSSSALVNRNDLKIGFSVRDTFASFDDVRVRKYSAAEPKTEIGLEEKVSK